MHIVHGLVAICQFRSSCRIPQQLDKEYIQWQAIKPTWLPLVYQNAFKVIKTAKSRDLISKTLHKSQPRTATRHVSNERLVGHFKTAISLFKATLESCGGPINKVGNGNIWFYQGPIRGDRFPRLVREFWLATRQLLPRTYSIHAQVPNPIWNKLVPRDIRRSTFSRRNRKCRSFFVNRSRRGFRNEMLYKHVDYDSSRWQNINEIKKNITHHYHGENKIYTAQTKTPKTGRCNSNGM